MADRTERVDLPALEVDPVDTLGGVISREPHRAIVEIRALYAVDQRRHLQRLEHRPVVVDVVAQQRLTPEAIHRIGDAGRWINRNERVVMLCDVGATRIRQRRRVIREHRLLAQLVVRLFERRVQDTLRHVDVADVIEAPGLPLVGNRGGQRGRLLQGVIGSEQPVVDGEDPTAVHARQPLAVRRIDVGLLDDLSGVGRCDGRRRRVADGGPRAFARIGGARDQQAGHDEHHRRETVTRWHQKWPSTGWGT